MSADNAAEQSVLGAMMLSAAAVAEAAAILTGPDFYRPDHEAVFTAIADLTERGQHADPVTVAEVLAKSGDLERCGGPAYLHLLINTVPSPGMAAHYAAIVRRHAQLRALGALGTRLASIADNPGTDLDDIPDLLLAGIHHLEAALAAAAPDTAPRVGDLLDATFDGIEHPEHTAVIATGLPDLDDHYPGHAPGQLVIIGARPAVGKSVVGLTFARAAANNGIHSLFISLEMSTTEVMHRLLAAESGVPLDHITKGACTEADWDRLANANARVLDLPLRIDDAPAAGLPQIRSTLTRLKRAGEPVGLLVVDYLQLMTAPRAQNREQSVAELSRGLKLLAREFGIPVIALAQLNRESEKRGDKTPVMSDLRESGALEADADTIMLLHREELYGDAETRPGECDVIVAKCRGGRPGKVVVLFQGHYARCVSFAKPWTPHTALRRAV